MTRIRYVTAGQRYRCYYTCTACGKRNRETGIVRAKDSLARNSYVDNWTDEVHLSDDLALGKAQERFYHMQTNVNDRRWLEGLRVSGVCRKCGMRQSWSPTRRYSSAALTGMVCYALLLGYCGLPEDRSFLLFWLLIALLAAAMANHLLLIVTRWRLYRQAEECAPWVEAVHPEN